jgi:hypothetical protein
MVMTLKRKWKLAVAVGALGFGAQLYAQDASVTGTPTLVVSGSPVISESGTDLDAPAYRVYWDKLFSTLDLTNSGARGILLMLSDDSNDNSEDAPFAAYRRLKALYGENGTVVKNALRFRIVNVNAQKEYIDFFGPKLLGWDKRVARNVFLLISPDSFVVQRYIVDWNASIHGIMLDIATMVDAAPMLLSSRGQVRAAFQDKSKSKLVLWTLRVGYDESYNELAAMDNLKHTKFGEGFKYYIILQGSDAAKLLGGDVPAIEEHSESTYAVWSTHNRLAVTLPVSECRKGLFTLEDMLSKKIDMYNETDLGRASGAPASCITTGCVSDGAMARNLAERLAQQPSLGQDNNPSDPNAKK